MKILEITKSQFDSSRVKFSANKSKTITQNKSTIAKLEHETANFGTRMLKFRSSEDFENCFGVQNRGAPSGNGTEIMDANLKKSEVQKSPQQK